MRIAHIITRMIIGGAQENTLLCCQDLVREFGDEVTLITGPALGPEGDLLEQEKSKDIAVEFSVVLVAELRRAIDPWRDWASYRALKHLLRDLRPDVVHTHSAKAGFLGRLAASAVGVRAIVHTVHGAPFHPFQPALARSLFRGCERYAARHCHALVSVSDAMTDLLVSGGVAPREKFTTIYSGMAVEPFLLAHQDRDAVRSELGFRADDVVVGKIARLFHLKGHEYVIRAAQQVVAQCPHVHFLLVGDGLLRGKLQQQIDQAGLASHFHFTGLVPPGRIPALMGAIDILVHASLREGLARALPQALIAGKPVVSFDIDGAKEVVIPGETGYLVEPCAVPPLAEAIIALARDPQLRQRMGELGRARFAPQFRHQHMTARLRELYERLLAGTA